MFRKSSLLIAALALALVVPVAHAAGGWSIGVNGGVTIPTGDFGSDDPTTGYNAGAGPQAGLDICYMVTDNFGIGLDGSWSQNKGYEQGTVLEDLVTGETFTFDKDDKFRFLRLGAHGKFMFPMGTSPVRPYAVIGGGIYNLNYDYQFTYFDPSGPTTIVFTDENSLEQPGTRAGGKVGLGASFKATEQVNIDVQANYNFVSMDEDKFGISSVQFIGIQAGVSFNIMPQ